MAWQNRQPSYSKPSGNVRRGLPKSQPRGAIGLKVSVKIGPRHPHLLIEWPARSRRLWRFRVGYRWDANAEAYLFPALSLKRVDGPMHEYQTDSQRRPKPT